MGGQARSERVAGEPKRELADVLCRDTADARLALLSISHVRVSRDLSFADVYVVSLKALKDNDTPERLKLMRALKSAAGFFRKRLASRTHWQKTPRLRFHYDDLPESGLRLESLIDDVAPKETSAAGGFT